MPAVHIARSVAAERPGEGAHEQRVEREEGDAALAIRPEVVAAPSDVEVPARVPRRERLGAASPLRRASGTAARARRGRRRSRGTSRPSGPRGRRRRRTPRRSRPASTACAARARATAETRPARRAASQPREPRRARHGGAQRAQDEQDEQRLRQPPDAQDAEVVAADQQVDDHEGGARDDGRVEDGQGAIEAARRGRRRQRRRGEGRGWGSDRRGLGQPGLLAHRDGGRLGESTRAFKRRVGSDLESCPGRQSKIQDLTPEASGSYFSAARAAS